MNKVTIITGPPTSGKTTLARELSEGKKTVFLTNFTFSDSFKEIDEDIEVIVIEYGIMSKNDLGTLKMLMTSKYITITKKGKVPVKIERPELIITTYSYFPVRERNYVSVIRLTESFFDVKSLPIFEDESKLDKSKVIEKIKKLTTHTRFKFRKSFCFFLLINLLAISAFSQLYCGFGIGYDIGKKPLGTMNAGYEIKNIRLEGEFTPSLSRSVSANNFMGFKIGYDIANFLTPSVGYYYNLVSTDNKELNKNYVGYSAKLVIPVNERGGVFMNAMYINKSTQFTFGAHCIF